ncbi:serine protease [Mechercharimyces sp. CAU 1602]|uniref:trypsin-like serine peptidase n=1 Tax=Mechercharimyces sp. CAU 1602 TaxID=2973933 RepID=UPI0021618686|nr:trypsin-like peptidase domain-containing protein [Mechercharimyces sp. CAU 1602]MCS1352063.1 trypsin-like peptidase domain-containing protein [Mechercharimyces sp. CAU 1602]
MIFLPLLFLSVLFDQSEDPATFYLSSSSLNDISLIPPHISSSSPPLLLYSAPFPILPAFTSDDQRRLTNAQTNQFPYSAVVLLRLQNNQGEWYSCSGWYIDSNSIVTAAHCVYDTYENEYFRIALIIPATDQEQPPCEIEYSRQFYVTRSWQAAQPQEPGKVPYEAVAEDYAIINVATSHPSWLAITSPIPNAPLFTAGYPAALKKERMVTNSGQLMVINRMNQIIHHNAYVGNGMSGGPILIYTDSTWKVVSINSTRRWGPLLDSWAINTLLEWAQKNDQKK